MAAIAIACCAGHTGTGMGKGKLLPLWVRNPKGAGQGQFCVRCSDESEGKEKKKKENRLSQQSSWEAKDAEGRDYLYRLGKEADNMNIAVGQRAGVIDSLFAGNFLGKDSDIVFDYRQKVTRSFEYLQGDYYIAPLFMVTNYFL